MEDDQNKTTVPIERIIEQEKNGAIDFAETEKRIMVAIVGMGGGLVSRIHDELIFEIPKGALDSAMLKGIICMRGSEGSCPACDAGIPSKERHMEDYMQAMEQSIIVDSIPTGILNSDLHSIADAFKEMGRLADEEATPPRKKNNIPKPYKRKGKFKYGWK